MVGRLAALGDDSPIPRSTYRPSGHWTASSSVASHSSGLRRRRPPPAVWITHRRAPSEPERSRPKRRSTFRPQPSYTPQLRMRLTLATRRSALALAQSRAFARSLMPRQPGPRRRRARSRYRGRSSCRTARSRTSGARASSSRSSRKPCSDGRADFAVHSLKDVPADLAPGLQLACIPAREDPRDVLVSRLGHACRATPGRPGRHLEPAARRVLLRVPPRPPRRARARQRRHPPS